MNRLTKDCRRARNDIIGLVDLDAVRRSKLDVHLRRCETCREVAQQFTAIEQGSLDAEVLTEERKSVIYNRLIPAINEIAIGRQEARGSGWLKPVFAGGLMVAGAALVVAIGLPISLFPPANENAETPVRVSAAKVVPAKILPAIPYRCEGQVAIDGRDGSTFEEFELKAGVALETQARSRFQFAFADGVRVALHGETSWRLSELDEKYMAMHLDRGQLAVSFEASSGQSLEVLTPDAIVRVVGTVFTVEVVPGEQTRIGVIEGTVRVFPKQGMGGMVEIVGGQSVSMPSAGEVESLVGAQKALASEIARPLEYPPSETRLVRFNGTPEQVKVEVDGRVLGTTPLVVRLPKKAVAYRLIAPGMATNEGMIEDTDEHSVSYALAPMEETRSRFRRRHRRQRILDSDTGAEEAWDDFSRARSAMIAGDVPFAIGLLKKAIGDKEGDDLLSVLTLLAECHSAVGEYEEAAAVYSRISAIVPGTKVSQNARYEVGRLAMDQLGDHARARAAFTAYVASPLGGALREEAYYSLCELNSRSGELEEALHCFDEFLRAFPGGHHEMDARLWHGAILQDVERKWALAEIDLQAFIDARPGHPRAEEARYRIALGRYQRGDLKGALRIIAEHLENHPDGQYRLRAQRLREAILKQGPAEK